MTSKYAIALYELVQLRGNLDRCTERFTLARFPGPTRGTTWRL